MAFSARSRPWRIFDAIAFAGIIGWVGYSAIGFNVFGQVAWPDRMVDYRLLYDFSKSIVETQRYPAQHSYPPSAIVFHYATAQFDFPTSAAIYLTCNIGAALACWWVLLSMLRIDFRPGSLVVVLLAFAAASPFFTWELRSQNCNLFFLLALLLGVWFMDRERPKSAGLCVALSFSLKLFSVLVIPYLLWKRQFRTLAWTVAFVALFWIVIPGVVFGPSGLVPVYREWFCQLQSNSSGRPDLDHPILISIHNSAHWIADGDQRGTQRIVYAVWMAWLAIAIVGWRTSRKRSDTQPDAFGLLADISLLTLGPIAVSPYFEQYHAVPYAIPATLLLHAATDVRQRPRLRMLALMFFATGLGLSLAPTDWSARGLWVNLNLMVATSGAAIVARFRQPASVPQQTVDVIAPRRAA
jgi:Glycosyltransferase family 87